MKVFKFCTIAAIAVALLATASPVFAASPEVTTHGDLRIRFDRVEDYDFDSASDDNANVWPYRAVFGLTTELAEGVSAVIDLQAFGTLGSQFGPQGALTGYSYGTDSGTGSGFDVDNIDLYQGYIALKELGGSNWDLYVGRGEVSIGNELHFGDNDFGNGRTFDGARAMAEFEGWDLDLMFANVNETGFLNFGSTPGFSGDDDSWIMAAHASFDVGDGSIAPYLINWRNDADGDGSLPLFANRIDLQTFGALWTDNADGEKWDASVEVAIQSGDLGVDGASQLSFGGTVIEAEFGWNLNEKRRLHVGYLNASGDDNGADTDFDAFVQIAPELSGSRLGYTDNTTISLTNIQDLSLGYACSWGEAHDIEISYHMLTLAEDGGGPDDLGDEIDVVYNFNYSDNARFQLGVAQLSVGDAIGPNADDALRAWGGLQVSWGK